MPDRIIQEIVKDLTEDRICEDLNVRQLCPEGQGRGDLQPRYELVQGMPPWFMGPKVLVDPGELDLIPDCHRR